MNTDIFVATHKPIKFDLSDEYHWVQVNATRTGQWKNYLHDDDGLDNISIKNNSYCELTALYRLWKESKEEYVGLCHYRRYFGQGKRADLIEKAGIPIKRDRLAPLLLKEEQIASYLNQYDIILGRPYCPYPLNVYEDLLRFVSPDDIEVMIAVIEQRTPEYAETLRKVLQSKGISYCNMFVTRRKMADRYCRWLFDVLGEIEKRIDISSYDASHARVFGYLAEVLLNVFVQNNQLAVKYVPLLTLDEDDTPISLKRRLFITYTLMKTRLNLTPDRWAKELWKSRFEFLQTDTEPFNRTSPVSVNSLQAYFNTVGGQNISISNVPVPHIRAEFDKSALYAFLCDNTTDTRAMLSEIDRIRLIEHPFSTANSIRIYPIGILNDSTKEVILHSGFAYAESGGSPHYYYSTK